MFLIKSVKELAIYKILPKHILNCMNKCFSSVLCYFHKKYMPQEKNIIHFSFCWNCLKLFKHFADESLLLENNISVLSHIFITYGVHLVLNRARSRSIVLQFKPKNSVDLLSKQLFKKSVDYTIITYKWYIGNIICLLFNTKNVINWLYLLLKQICVTMFKFYMSFRL